MEKQIKKKKVSVSTVLMVLLFVIIGALTLLPFYSLFLASFRPGTELMRHGLGLGIDLPTMSFNNYKLLFTGDTPYFTWFLNSLKITVVQTVLTLFVSAFVGYGFAMYDFKGKNLIFTCVLFV